MQYVKYVFVGLFVVGLIFGLLLRSEAYTSEAFAALAGSVLSLVFEYFPWVAGDYSKLGDGQKRLVMGALIFLGVGGAFALSCTVVIVAFSCTFSGILDALYVFVFAVAMNQGTYRLARKSSE